MKFKELIAKPEAQLRKELLELQDEMESLTVKIRLGQVKNTNELRSKRKLQAQIYTALKQK